MSGFIPLSVPNFGAREAELAGLAITSGWVSTSGGKVTEFEEKLAAYVGMPRAVACNAGTSALHLAAMAAGITRGDEVIVPTLTFIAAVNPLTRYVGAEPIFIGCDDSLCIDPDAVEDFCANHCALRDGKLYNKKTGAHVKALEVVHVFGNLADMPRLMAIAERYGLIVIEDATEALGTRLHRRSLCGPVCRHHRRHRLLQLQRQQDHHDRRGRRSGIQPRRLGRACQAPLHPGQGRYAAVPA